MAGIERLVAAGLLRREAERLRLGPRLERLPRTPDRVRRIERVIAALRPAQQMERHKARDAAKMRVAIQPNLFKRLLLARQHVKTVHRDEHLDLLGAQFWKGKTAPANYSSL